MEKFCVPEVGDNPNGWGPVEEPAHLKNIPYAPFSKNEKLGKIADFAQPAHHQKHYGRPGQQPQGPLVFNLLHDEEDAKFRLVDTRSSKPPGYRQQGTGQRRQQPHQRRGREDNRDGGRPYQHQQQQRRQYIQPGQKHNWNYRRDPPKQTVVYSSSIEIRPEWISVEEMEFSALSRLPPETIPTPVDLYVCGQLEYCDKSFDLCTPKTEKNIHRTKRIFHNVTTSDDPIMRNFAAEDKGHVFVTDSILAAVMCSTRSIYSWDIVMTKVGDKLFLDRRDQVSGSYLTINETAPDAVPEDKDNINGVQQLSIEATVATQNFSQQILKKGQKCSFKNPNPFVTDTTADVSSCGYKYRKWSFRDGQLDVIVRSEIDALQEAPKRPALVSTKAFVEYCQRQGAHIDWRQRLESQRGAVFATELKNNGNKIAKWITAALLADVDLMKIGSKKRQRFLRGVKQMHRVKHMGPTKRKARAFSLNLPIDKLGQPPSFVARNSVIQTEGIRSADRPEDGAVLGIDDENRGCVYGESRREIPPC